MMNSILQGKPVLNPHSAILLAASLAFVTGAGAADVTYIRLNGEQVTSPTTTGFSGDYDLLVGLTFAEAIKSDAFACAHYRNNLGGLELGEAILSRICRPERQGPRRQSRGDDGRAHAA